MTNWKRNQISFLYVQNALIIYLHRNVDVPAMAQPLSIVWEQRHLLTETVVQQPISHLTGISFLIHASIQIQIRQTRQLRIKLNFQ